MEYYRKIPRFSLIKMKEAYLLSLEAGRRFPGLLLRLI